VEFQCVCGCCDITTNISVTDNLKTSKIVVKLLEPLLHKGYTLYIDSYNNLPYLALLLNRNGVNSFVGIPNF
jgi:hypothetical protein